MWDHSIVPVPRPPLNLCLAIATKARIYRSAAAETIEENGITHTRMRVTTFTTGLVFVPRFDNVEGREMLPTSGLWAYTLRQRRFGVLFLDRDMEGRVVRDLAVSRASSTRESGHTDRIARRRHLTVWLSK
jgi:hypothetical protein